MFPVAAARGLTPPHIHVTVEDPPGGLDPAPVEGVQVRAGTPLLPGGAARAAALKLAAELGQKGNVYVLTAGATTSLFRVGPDGKALSLVLPDGFALGSSTPPAVMATGPDDIWLFAAANGKLDVFRTKPNAPAIDVTLPNPQAEIFAKMERAEEAAAAKAQAKEKLVFAKAYSSKCATPFVLLYTLAKTAPADYDFPATRDALKGHTELAGASFIEFSRGGKRFFGAVVPSGALGQKLVDAVKGKVVGSTPQLVCDGPAPDRTLAIDLATGKIKPLGRGVGWGWGWGERVRDLDRSDHGVVERRELCGWVPVLLVRSRADDL